jgi:hypothetical protein
MARILLVTGLLANIPYYHQAWLFEPLSFLLCWTAVTTMKMAITPFSGRMSSWERTHH